MDKIKIKGISFVEQSHILVKYWYWGELELRLGGAFVSEPELNLKIILTGCPK